MIRPERVLEMVETLLDEKQAEYENIPYDKNSEEYFEQSEKLGEEIAKLEEVIDLLEELS